MCVLTARNGARGSRRGFTMLEVMFGTLVLAISLLAAFSSQVLSLNLVRTSRDVNTATSELTAALEEVITPSIDAIPTTYAPNTAIAKFAGRALRDESIVVAYPNFAGGAVPNPLEVVVTITWTAWNGRPATLSLATMKAR